MMLGDVALLQRLENLGIGSSCRCDKTSVGQAKEGGILRYIARIMLVMKR